MANIVIDSNLLIIISAIVFALIVFVVAYIIYKDRKQDKNEIEDLIQDLHNNRVEQPETKIEVNKNILEIDSVLDQMQKDLNAKPEEVVANFEREQEEKAIISYQELVKTLKKGKEENIVKIKDEDLEPVKEETADLENIVEEIKNPIKKQEPKNEKFKNTEFISPIYGKMDEHIEYPKIKNFKNSNDLEEFDKIYESYNMEDYLEEFSDQNININTLEQTLDLEPISNEIKKNEEFLKALKDFRENL